MSNSVKIHELKETIARKENEARKLGLEIASLKDDIEFSEKEFDSALDYEKETYIETETEKINDKYDPQIEALEDEIESLQDSLSDNSVDEDSEEYREAKRCREYLNTTAGILHSFHTELARVSSPYFIDLAYNEEVFKKPGQFKKAFRTIPDRVNELKNYRENLYFPFDKVEARAEKKGINSAYYFWGTIGSPLTCLGFFKSLSQSAKRAKYLHESARFYHKMMHTLKTFKDKTEDEINELFSNLLKLRSEQIESKIKEKTAELSKLNAEKFNAIEQLAYDEASFVRQHSLTMSAKNKSLDEKEERLSALEEELKDLRKQLRELQDEHLSELDRTMNDFLLGRSKEDRIVALPDQLIYDRGPQNLIMFSTQPSLYLYEDRETIDNFMRLFLFQVRNVMEYGAVQFRFFDIKDGGFIDGFKLPASDKANNQDIFTYSLKEEQTKGIDMVHDMLRRRKGQVQFDINVGDYNQLQKQNGSSPLSYQMLFFILDDALKLDDKLKQLVHNGSRLGLYTYVFMKKELINVNLSKVTQDYISRYVEITPSGLTSYDSLEYTEKLEAIEAEKKIRI